MRPVHVHGVGLHTPGFASAGAWCRGEFDAERPAAAASILSGASRRRASSLTRMAVDVLEQALGQAGFPVAETASVWGTAHGDIATAVAILEKMQSGDGRLSPTQFHNSVYNTASGYASIATGNRARAITLAGGGDLPALCLLEAWCLLESGEPHVVVVLADEPLHPPFDPHGAREPLAVAFALGSEPTGAQARLSGFGRDGLAAIKPHDRFGSLYVAAALPLLERVVARRPGSVALETERDGSEPVWSVDVEPVEESA